MKLNTVLRTTGLALGVALLAACASNPTKVGDVWVAPGVTKLEAKRAIVVALAPNEAARRRMETEMSMRMTRVNATDSNIVLSAEELKDPAKAPLPPFYYIWTERFRPGDYALSDPPTNNFPAPAPSSISSCESDATAPCA